MFGDFLKQFGFPGIPEQGQEQPGAAPAVPGGNPIAANPMPMQGQAPAAAPMPTAPAVNPGASPLAPSPLTKGVI